MSFEYFISLWHWMIGLKNKLKLKCADYCTIPGDLAALETLNF